MGPEDVSELRRYQKSLGLSDESTLQARQHAFLYLVELMAYNRAPFIGEWAQKYLKWLGLDGFSDDVMLTAYAILATNMIEQDMARGTMPVVPDPMIRLKPNEVCHLEIAGYMVEHQVINSGIRGGYTGLSVPVYRGIRAHFGGSDRRYYSEKGFVLTSSGMLSITNTRIVYMGNPKGFAITWPQLVAAEPSEHGVVFYTSTRQTPHIFMPTAEILMGAISSICAAYA